MLTRRPITLYLQMKIPILGGKCQTFRYSHILLTRITILHTYHTNVLLLDIVRSEGTSTLKYWNIVFGSVSLTLLQELVQA